MASFSIAIDRERSFLACMAEGEMLLDAERDAEGGRNGRDWALQAEGKDAWRQRSAE